MTGSCTLVTSPTLQILVDCGLFQGSRFAAHENYEAFPFDPRAIDVLLLTHGHLDHCGRIPKLVHEGFRGRILATGPTAQFSKIILEDSLHLLTREAEEHGHASLYSAEDLALAAPLFENNEQRYHAPLALDEHTTVEFFDAGHILGSSIIQLTTHGKTIVFSGDLGNPPVPLLGPTEFIASADAVVMESTYGGRIHEDRKERTLLLQSAIYETAVMKGVLMIPAFAIERTQELLYELNALVNNHDIPPLPIFLDSPLAIKATRIFQQYPDFLNTEASDMITSGDDIFHFPNLHTTLATDASKRINDIPPPKVIIAGSGMAQGGRIVHHIQRYIGDFRNHYLIIGYQVEGSLGRRLLDGEKRVRVLGATRNVEAKISAIGGYSAHADQERLKNWLGHFDSAKLRHLFLNHGERGQAELLRNVLTPRMTATQIAIPTFGEEFELS